MISQCRAIVVSWALSNGNLSLLLCCKGLVSVTLHWRVQSSTIHFFHVHPCQRHANATMCPEGAFSKAHSDAALSFCDELIPVALSLQHSITLKWFHKVAFHFCPSRALSGTSLLPAWRSFLHSCTAVYQVEKHLQLQWKWKNSEMTSHLIPKKGKKDILWKFLQQKQRLWILQTPAFQSLF